MPYLGKQSEQVGVSVQKYEYLQGTDTSSGTTSFSVPSDSGDHVNVWLNGILLKEGGSNDYSKSNTAITFNSAPSDNDLIRIDVVESFALPDALKSSGDTMEGALKLDGGIKQQTSADLSGTYADHQFMLSDSFSVTGDVTISDNLILSKLSDDGNAITLTNDTSTRTITGTGSLETSTLAQTPNASLSGMTGEIGSTVTFPTGVVRQTKSYFSQDILTCTTAADTHVDLPTFQVKITPSSANSKILIILNMGAFNFTSGNYGISGGGQMRRKIGSGSFSSIGIGNQNAIWNASFALWQANGTQAQTNVHCIFLDSPNTTEECTYGIAVNDHNNNVQTFYLNRQAAENQPYAQSYGSSLIAMEVV